MRVCRGPQAQGVKGAVDRRPVTFRRCCEQVPYSGNMFVLSARAAASACASFSATNDFNWAEAADRFSDHLVEAFFFEHPPSNNASPRMVDRTATSVMVVKLFRRCLR